MRQTQRSPEGPRHLHRIPSGCRTCGQLSWLQAASPCLRIISLQGGQLDGAMTAKALSLERWGGGGYDGKKKANLASRTRATQAGIMSFDKLQYFGHLMQRVDSLEETLMLCRGTFGGLRKAVRDRFALQGGTGDFP